MKLILDLYVTQLLMFYFPSFLFAFLIFLYFSVNKILLIHCIYDINFCL